MWKQGIAAIALLALTACGGNDDEPEADKTASVTVEPSEAEESALDQACTRIVDLAPATAPGDGWSDVLDEAEYLTDSDDAEVRDAARDLVATVEPIVTAWEDGASATEWERITSRFDEEWGAFRDEWCPEV